VRLIGILALIAIPGFAEWTLYVCASTTKDYVVGAKLLPSGLFRRTAAGWQHVTHRHPFMFALDFDSRDPSAVYVAAGNGLIRVPRDAQSWKILTAEDVTELRDVNIDPQGTVYFAHTAGIRMSSDAGKSWREIGTGRSRRYTEAIRADRARAGVLIAGGEDGLWRSENTGESWQRGGAAGLQIMHIEQSPHEPCFWLAGTQSGGLFASRDCGRSFENSGNIGVGTNIYDIAFDPVSKTRIALAIWGRGVMVSEDDGRSWHARNESLPNPNIWSVVFDPDKSGRMFASVHEEAIYVSEDGGKSWMRDGVEGSIVHRMKFVPGSGVR
jgi:photosystem II stability/assembly factor-like uncharacterized protein